MLFYELRYQDIEMVAKAVIEGQQDTNFLVGLSSFEKSVGMDYLKVFFETLNMLFKYSNRNRMRISFFGNAMIHKYHGMAT